MTDPTLVPREAFEGLKSACDSNKALLLHHPMLLQFLTENGFETTAAWVRGHHIETDRAFFHGFEPEDERAR